jgi:hypothetical protein
VIFLLNAVKITAVELSTISNTYIHGGSDTSILCYLKKQKKIWAILRIHDFEQYNYIRYVYTIGIQILYKIDKWGFHNSSGDNVI